MPRQFNKTEEDILDDINDGPVTRTNDTTSGGADGGHDSEDDDEVHDNVDQGGQGAKDNANAGDEDEEDEGGQEGAKPAAKPKDGKAGDGKSAAKQPKGKTAEQIAQDQANSHRRLAQDNIKLKNTNQQLTNDLNTTRTQLNALQTAFGAINSQGLAAEEVAEGARLMKLYKQDPIQAIAEILTTSKENGIDLSKLNLATIDTNAIRALIQKEVGGRVDPLLQRQQLQDQHAEDKAAAMQELDDFLAVNTEAEAHLEAITKVMSAQPGITLEAAWDKVQAWAYRNGIDLFTPANARQNGAQGGANQQQVRRPLPNGGGRQIAGNGSGEAPASPKPRTQARQGQSWDDIVSEAMAESGMSYRR